MIQSEFRKRYINYLLGQGLDRVEAVRLYDKGTGRGDDGYSAQWYAREEAISDYLFD
jgi:hypothetical protein